MSVDDLQISETKLLISTNVFRYPHIRLLRLTTKKIALLWPPYGIGQAITFMPCGFFLLRLLSFFPRLILAVGDWMSTILPQIVRP